MGSVVGEFRTAVEVVAPLLVGVAIVTVLLAATVRRERVVGILGAGLFAGGALLIVAATLLPAGAAAYEPGVNLEPFATVRAYLDHGDPVLTTRNVLLNVALFVPAATGLVLWLRLRPWLVVAGGLLVSVGIEATQLLLPLGRTADVDDVLLNAIGAVLGAVAASLARMAHDSRARSLLVSGRSG